MKKILTNLIVIYLILILAGCASQEAAQTQSATENPSATESQAAAINEKEQETIMLIKPAEGKELLEGENPPLLVDVRTLAEFSESHIPNAINVPLDDVVNGLNSLGIAKDSPVIVYCRSGARSADAAQKLSAAGYSIIYDLGGIINWPYETVK